MPNAIKFRLPILFFLAILISCPPVNAHRDPGDIVKSGPILLLAGIGAALIITGIVIGIGRTATKDYEGQPAVTLEDMLPTAFSVQTAKEKLGIPKQVQLEFNSQAFDLGGEREDHFNGPRAYTDQIQGVGLLITIPFK